MTTASTKLVQIKLMSMLKTVHEDSIRREG